MKQLMDGRPPLDKSKYSASIETQEAINPNKQNLSFAMQVLMVVQVKVNSVGKFQTLFLLESRQPTV